MKPIHFLFRSRNLGRLLVLVSASYFQANLRANSADLNALGGRWKFNQAKSDNPQTRLDAALGDGNAFMLALKRKQAQAVLQQFITATEALTITCQPETVTIMAQGRPSRTLYLDGRKQDFESPNGSKTSNRPMAASPMAARMKPRRNGATASSLSKAPIARARISPKLTNCSAARANCKCSFAWNTHN